jgi:small subunit ribosomal protein S24e
MEAKIESVRHNPLLGRTEFDFELEHDGESTPSEEDLKERVAAEQDFDPEEIEVVGIYTKYGNNLSEATIYVFEDLDLERFEDKMEEEPVEETSTASSADVDYDEIVDNTISDAKEELQDLDDPDYGAALEAEKDNKNRTTFVEWLESQ